MFGFINRKQFYKLTKTLYDLKYYNERKKFLIKCRFYCLVPKHLNFITKNVRNNHMFSNKCKVKQNKLIDNIMFQLLNIEIINIKIPHKNCTS